MMGACFRHRSLPCSCQARTLPSLASYTPWGYTEGIKVSKAMAGYSSDKQAILKRLSRIEGQIRGVRKMVEEDRYCIDVLDQVSAVNGALDRVALSLLRDHLDHCVVDAVRKDSVAGREKLDEAIAAVDRLVKS